MRCRMSRSHIERLPRAPIGDEVGRCTVRGRDLANEELSCVDQMISRSRGASTRREGDLLYVILRIPFGVRAFKLYAGDGNASRILRLVDQARGPLKRRRALRYAINTTPGVQISLFQNVKRPEKHSKPLNNGPENELQGSPGPRSCPVASRLALPLNVRDDPLQ